MNSIKENEKYYWETQNGLFIPVHELTNLHICNIVMKFGKDCLINTGHSIIVEKFEELNKKYNFFQCLQYENRMDCSDVKACAHV